MYTSDICLLSFTFIKESRIVCLKGINVPLITCKETICQSSKPQLMCLPITATELFIEHLTASSAELTLNKGRKVISRSDVDEVS